MLNLIIDGKMKPGSRDVEHVHKFALDMGYKALCC